VVRPMIWWAAADEWVPLSDAEYLAPACSVPHELPVVAPALPVYGCGYVVLEYDGEAESYYNEVDCGQGRSVSI
jgi:hypothetical protein